MTNEIPRRAYVEKWSVGEAKISEAVQAVEGMGADVRLTEAVVLLGKAQDKVADYVDGVGLYAVDAERGFDLLCKVAPQGVTSPSPAANLIVEECEALKEMLLRKNRLYGNSALEPMRIASRAPAHEQILVRIDDKLSRIKSAQADEDEDIWGDLLGYIVLLRIARKKASAP